MKYSKAVQLSTLLAIATLLSTSLTPSLMMSALALEPSLDEETILMANELDANETLEQNRAAFFASDYTYEDAVALSEFWGKTPYDTKAIMGEKLLAGGDFEQSLIEKLAIAKQEKARRPLTADEILRKERNAFFASEEYTYHDAVVLAEYWRQPLVDAKARIGRKLMWGDEDLQILAGSLQTANANSEAGKQNQSLDAVRTQQDAFFASERYDYWDAAVLSTYWDQDLGESKARIGRLLLSGTEENMIVLGNSLGDAQRRRIQRLGTDPLQLYEQYTTPEGNALTYDDAVQLAEYWNLSSAYDAKLRVEEKLILSDPEGIDQALRDA